MPDIVLKDRNGNPVNFYGAEYLDAVTPDGTEIPYAAYDPDTLTPENLASGVKVGDVVGTMTVPEVVENLPIALDFSGGDQEIIAPDGVVVKSAIIQKPENLKPENIPEGMDIAGIIGTLAAGGNNVKFAAGTISGDQSSALEITHNLGITPEIVLLRSSYVEGYGYVAFVIAVSKGAANAMGFSPMNIATQTNSSGVKLVNNFSHVDITSTATNPPVNNATEKTLNFYASSNYKIKDGSTWLAIGGLT